jgi:hypothetical protein
LIGFRDGNDLRRQKKGELRRGFGGGEVVQVNKKLICREEAT